MSKDVLKSQDDYKYGFHDEDTSVYNTGKGLSEATIRAISAIKKEPEEWAIVFSETHFSRLF